MAKVKSEIPSTPRVKTRPALTDEGRELRLISKAMDLVEERLDNGTASSQETTHFLKLGTEKYKLEREKIAAENKLIMAKAEAIESAKETEKLYSEAIKAMQRYSGHGDSYDDEDEYQDIF